VAQKTRFIETSCQWFVRVLLSPVTVTKSKADQSADKSQTTHILIMVGTYRKGHMWVRVCQYNLENGLQIAKANGINGTKLRLSTNSPKRTFQSQLIYALNNWFSICGGRAVKPLNATLRAGFKCPYQKRSPATLPLPA